MKNRYQTTLMKRKGWGWLILLFFIAIFVVPSLLQASESKINCEVEYINERLTVNVDNVALGPVLAAIREKTGIEFEVGQEESERLISIRVGPLPLVESLKRILNHFNHALLLDSGNKPIKVVILGYAKLDSSPPLRELTATAGVQRVISPSSEETRNVQPATKERMVIPSSLGGMDINQPAGKGVISMYSLEPTVIQKASVEDLVVTPLTETMVIGPPLRDMPIMPPSETMVITPASVEMIVMPPSVEMVIVPPNAEAMASFVDNVIIKSFTGKSKPKAP